LAAGQETSPKLGFVANDKGEFTFDTGVLRGTLRQGGKSLGLAPVFILATDLIVGAAPPERAGAASAISETSSEFGGALGIAVLGSIGAAVYRSQLANTLPIGVPSDAAAIARDTLGGAVAIAGRLPDQVGAQLLDTARNAFVQSFELAAGISAAIALTTALVATALLRHERPAHPEELV
jgi:DHA2 family multidrug resistance protein-like MFS transporter